MAKCKLGPKKIKRLEDITGRKIIQAFVRGGWPHGYALVEFEDSPQPWSDEEYPGLTNYRTGASLDEEAERDPVSTPEDLERYKDRGPKMAKFN